MGTTAANTRAARRAKAAARPHPVGVSLPADPTALWYKNAVIYELHVRSFCDSTGDGIGDFNGLISKLDYLEDLGITAVWLLPFYPSPLRDDGYDIADFLGVNPSYGTLQDVKRFILEAHRRNIRVITELVVNHTSDQHPWFQRARRAPKNSPERNFYVWSDASDRYSGARIIFKDFETSNWAWDPLANQYYWHRFYAHQPDLNFDNPAVHKAVMDVCDAWMEAGVDGMRLDAIPYLYEREGTSCENLPETHEFLRKLRAHVDRKFPGRMLLAEANQWPEDAIAYFGSGDECHMAFHFPLMPRLFMSLRMEDRYPIIDILEQTPPIPENSHWALFLRNHDELTLEMVTDEERDYMYRVYASDNEARINLGIRRRLAPLLSNNRRKIELMNALLFSLPGTPVIYYGDELGMGDNVYLGDRDGVRTPMQWSGDRNAGFSRANPQRLFLPTIIDPEYHYETVNVESQQANPSSLLWWMKRLVSLRKKHPVFGHGAIRFLSPENPRVLAFVRQHGDESVLVVANLSRFVQPVSLNLAEFAGWRPVEMFGKIKFPVIKDEPYFLSLGPHSFFWFLLEPATAASVAGPTGAQAPEVRCGVPAAKYLSAPELGRDLERLLPSVLPARRWFASKARTLRNARVAGRIPINQPGAAKGSRVLTLVKTEFAEGEPEIYAMPLAIDPRNPDQPRSSTLAILTDGSQTPHEIYDAMSDGEFARVLLRLSLSGGAIETDSACLRGTRIVPAVDDATLRSLAAKVPKLEQSNSTVFFGDSLIFKLFRRLDSGPNPEFEIGRHLTERVKFAHTAPLAGAVHLSEADGRERTLGVVLRFVPNQGDAWSWMLTQAVKFIEHAAALPATEAVNVLEMPAGGVFDPAAPGAAFSALVGQPIEAARLLGQRTAEMHAALADDRGDPAFAPEPFTLMYQRSLFQSIRNSVRSSMVMLKKAVPTLPESIRAAANELVHRESDLLAPVQAVTKAQLPGSRTRTHGDYHLGQVLWTGRDFVIIDFEGEPARSIGERRLKRSPLRDVAGMLRSFDYAAWCALRRHREMFPGGGEREGPLSAAAAAWSAWLGRSFANAYTERMSELNPALIGRDHQSQSLLLQLWMVEKVMYEIAYELNSRPDWVDIPVGAALALAHRPA